MSLSANYGSQYYTISCGVSSLSGMDTTINYGSSYYYLSANDFILWAQPVHYTAIQANSGSQFYFYQSGLSSDSGLSLSANYGTHFYYVSAFDLVSFCN